MWDDVDQSVGERRFDELKTDHWKAMIMHGAKIARCRSDDDSSKRIIQQILDQEADLKEVEATESGQELYSQLDTRDEKRMLLVRRIDEERKVAGRPQTAPGSSQVCEESPATVNIEDLETDDIVIAYVIQFSTVECLTRYP